MSSEKVPGLILDRDGTIVEFVNYLHRPEEVRLLAGAADLIRCANDSGIPVGVATNQAGIDRGFYGWKDFHAVEAEVARQLDQGGADIDGVAACPFHPEVTPSWNDSLARWRKPGPGMYEALAQGIHIDLERSWAVGDNITDIEAARASNMAGAIHVATGHGEKFREEALSLGSENFLVFPAANLFCAQKIVAKYLYEAP
jgi:D-glycero-D-manno-heptose 1,7-bisphosphate phosphatase